MMLRMMFGMLAALGLSGCVGHHVQFAHPAHFADAPGETRIFMDARGDLYPRTGLPKDFEITKAVKGSLFNASRSPASGLCTNPEAGTELAHMCAAVADGCEAQGPSACFDAWQNVQQAMWTARAAEIGAAAAPPPGGDTTILVLIHGFNNVFSQSQASFALAQKQMRRFAPKTHKLHVVEVYWDGCKSAGGPGCWGKAQFSGPLAGFALRQMFNRVEHKQSSAPESGGPDRPYHWRVLTHSSGAFVAGATFGNPGRVLPMLTNPDGNPWYGRFKANATAQESPLGIPRLANVKLGMFAAATTYQTFMPTADGQGLANQPMGLLLSVHGYDSVLSKKGLGCRGTGVTCLGLRQDQAIMLKDGLAAAKSDVRYTWYDFTRTAPEWGRERAMHDYAVYLRQGADNTTFLRDLMDERIDVPSNGAVR